jgi:hypothetical protein
MHERHDTGTPNELGIAHSERKACGIHVTREPFRHIGNQRYRYINIRTEPRHAVGNDGLGAEDIPAPPPGHDRRKRGQ